MKPCAPRRPGRRQFLSYASLGPGSNLGSNLLGEMGARDPTAGEIETNFSDKVWFNWNTEHIIKPPDAIKKLVGLSSREILPVSELRALNDSEINLLRQQVAGWRVASTSEAGLTCLRNEWKAKDTEAAVVLRDKLQELSMAFGHPATVSVSGTDVTIQLTTPSVGALSENDFILASKVNELALADLLAKKRMKYWA